jgi:hypothetical protein
VPETISRAQCGGVSGSEISDNHQCFNLDGRKAWPGVRARHSDFLLAAEPLEPDGKRRLADYRLQLQVIPALGMKQVGEPFDRNAGIDLRLHQDRSPANGTGPDRVCQTY